MTTATMTEPRTSTVTLTDPDDHPCESYTRMLTELGTPVEFTQLMLDPVYYGFGVPRGRGTPVLVLPGFMGSDLYLMPLLGWLLRVGYRPYESTLLRNVGCPNELARRLLARIERIADETGEQVAIVGHSRGGLLARGLACARPELVSQVIALGSPFTGSPRVSPMVRALWSMTRNRSRGSVDTSRPATCETSECTCEYVQLIRGQFPCSVPFTSIYSRGDGVVHWRNCLDSDANNNIEVFGSHVGLVFNAAVYRHLALLLATHPVHAVARSA